MKTNGTGVKYWQSVGHLAESPEIQEMISQEFPTYDPAQMLSGGGGTSRRSLMKYMAASMALAGLGLGGCRRWPKEEIVPFSASPKGYVPGEPMFYATTMELGGVGAGLLITSYDGRPIKVEGNPLHPFNKTAANYGAADVYGQAATLELYDPERSRTPIDRTGRRASVSTLGAVQQASTGYFTGRGADVAVLSEISGSPSAADMKARFLAKFPDAKWYDYEPITRDNELAGTRLVFGQALRPFPHLEKAMVVVSMDEDFFLRHPAHTRLSSDWAVNRRSADEGRMSRFYVAESAFTITGAKADVRLPVKPSEVEAIVRALAVKLGVPGVSGAEASASSAGFIDSVAADIRANLGKSVVLAGNHLSPEAHALVAAINVAVGGGQTVTYHDVPGVGQTSSVDAIRACATDLGSGRVKTLLILGGNPVYDAPADLGFDKLVASIPNSIHLGVYDNETSRLSKWHVNRAHWLEAWGDTRAWDGTTAVAQPLILPIYNGLSSIELLSMLVGDELTSGQDIVRRTLKLTGLENEKAWRQVLNDGVVPNSASASATPTPRPFRAGMPPTSPSDFELRFVVDTKVYDGRFANSGWLQELPDQMSKVVWDNFALISLPDAEKLGIDKNGSVKLTVGGKSLDIAAYLMPGQPVGSITVQLGYGRTAAGNVGGDTDRGTPVVGVNTYALRMSGGMNVTPVTVEKSAVSHKLVSTIDHFLIDDVGFRGRDERAGDKGGTGVIIREASFDVYKKAVEKGKPREPFYGLGHGNLNLQLFNPPHPFNDPHAWAMSIDMSACTGCSACVVACQAENNIPVVGKTEVETNREMHWIRIDRYFRTEGDTVEERKSDPNPQAVFQPMLCVHCENAPCEQVCPVAATVHDTEGLNTMVYNRCIGTRYCANNCPYKVRKFNYYDWHSLYAQNGGDSPRFPLPWLLMPDQQQVMQADPILSMVQNPEVTVRMRGVMEKCTYCIQRIKLTSQHARRDHAQGKRASPLVNDGEVVTACQQACPTQAIMFGNLNDTSGAVTKLHQNPRAYGVLEEYNTRPRGKHLAIIRNVPAQPTDESAEPGHA